VGCCCLPLAAGNLRAFLAGILGADAIQFVLRWRLLTSLPHLLAAPACLPAGLPLWAWALPSCLSC
jgi:hypothetical protein